MNHISNDAEHEDRRLDMAAEARRVLISLAVMLAMVAVVFLFNVPNPNMLLITGLAVFTSLYGYPSGIACALVMILYSMYFFSEGNNFITFTVLNLQKMGVIVLGVVLNTLFIGNLKRQHNEANRKLRRMNALLEADNQTLEAASLSDALTGARNRYALRRDYGRYENQSLHVMMLDLDDFKRINDTYGHATGDFALKKVSRLLTEAFGAESCYRYGGDEFLVIREGMEEGDFAEKMAALKDRLTEIRLSNDGQCVHFSAGYTYGECEMSFDLRLMMHQADDNLYAAKALGKDCYVGDAFSREDALALERDNGHHTRELPVL